MLFRVIILFLNLISILKKCTECAFYILFMSRFFSGYHLERSRSWNGISNRPQDGADKPSGSTMPAPSSFKRPFDFNLEQMTSSYLHIKYY